MPGSASLPFDWFILLLRLLFIVLIYLFLYWVAKVTLRELIAVGTASSQAAGTVAPQASRLEVVDPAQSSYAAGEAIALGHYDTIGRAGDNSIQLDDGYVSGHHAEVAFEHGQWLLRDLGSRNGTFVNGQRVVGPTLLGSGDIVQFGRMQLRFAA